jgi:hypothetical protein
MGGMSPLGRFILIMMLSGVRFAAAALAAVFVLVVWQKGLSGAAAGMTRQDYVALAVLAVLFLAALWFAHAVKKELAD